MELIEFEEKATMSREEAASVLASFADQLARHNSLEFRREGMKYSVDVADEVEIEIEIEIGSDGSSLEIEVSWA